ncbi:MAG: hypothetical protein IJ719_16250 [Clostridia bacterium]|nr:hypothetical protein [Clostridia bacterium]
MPDVDALENEVKRLKDALMERYEAFVDGKISRNTYIAFWNKNKAQTAETEQKLSFAKGQTKYLTGRKEALEPLAKIAGEMQLTREMLVRTADAVYWNDGDVELKLKADEFPHDEHDVQTDVGGVIA